MRNSKIAVPLLFVYICVIIIKSQIHMKHYLSFEGRIGRLEYFLTCVVFNACYAVLGIFERLISPELFLVLYVLLAIPSFWFLWAQGAKRCHDLGHNGWWQCIPFYVLWMVFAVGLSETNQYGEPID